ncbi:tail fiber domain-containing protein [Candidatus Parcubacteria bacterium]|nr:tail fiber domain-containing protein [Candidatus Parcubacteria bacterium]
MKKLFAKFTVILILTTLVVGGLPISTQAAFNASFNPEINYQGRLVDNSNVAVADGTYNMRFNLYTTSSGGSSLWTETLTGSNRVPVASGLFSVMLGSTTPLTSLDFNQTLYLGVEIGGTAGVPTWDGEMTPRKIIGAVPAAIVSDTLDGLDSRQFARTDATSTISTNSAETILTINQTGAGNVLDVQRNGSSALLVDSSGNVTLSGTLTSGTVNGQTISAAANFTGTLTATGGLTSLSNLLLSGSSTLQNFTSINSTSSQATSTKLFSTSGTFTTLCLTGDVCRTTWPTGGSGSGGNSKWATSTNSDITPNGGGGIMVFSSSTITALNIGTSTTTSATSTNIFSTTASSTNVFFTAASGGSLTSTGLGTFSNILSLSSTTLQNFTFINATGSAATTTNFFSTTSSSTNLFSTLLTTGAVASGLVNGQNISSVANFTGTLTVTSGLTSLSNLLLSGSSTLQNFTFVNATGTSATTTNLFATTASSTSLFTTTLYGGTVNGFGLSMCNGASESLIWSGGVFGCHTVAGGGGGGSAAGTWSTTTSQVVGEFINYPNNSSDVVVIGSSATTSAKFYFDPNTSFGKIAGDLLVTGSSTLQNFTGLNNTTTNATSTTHFSTISSSTNLFSTALTTGLITSGLINSQTISSAANFTGTLTVTSGLTSLSNLLLSGSSTLLSFTGQNNTTTNATTTTIFSTTSSSTNLFSTILTTGLINGQTISAAANFTGTLTATGGLTSLSNLLLSGSSTLQNFTALQSTSTNATTTNFFATTASSTNLFSSLLTVGNNALVVNSSGNVGVGGSPSSQKLTVGGSIQLSGTDLITTGNQLRLLDSTSNVVFRGIRSSAWVDSVDSRFFQVGDTNDNVIFSAANATSISRLLFLADKVQISASGQLGYSNLAAPTNLFELYDSSNVSKFAVSTGGNVGIGTSTSQWALQVASSTKAQLTLSDGSLTSNHWSFRNAGGNFYLATSSPSTFATSTVAALTINSTGVVTLGNDLIVTGNSTTTNATTTNLFSTTASTSNLYIAVGPCSGTNALNISGGKVTCGVVSGSGSASSTLLGDNNHFTGENTIDNLNSIRSTTTNATTTNIFSTTASSTNLFGSTMKIGFNALTVNSSGNVGIGLASATFKLDVSGNVNFASDKSLYQGGLRILDASSTNSTTILGLLAGNVNAFDGSFNTFLGYQAGTLVTTSDNNTFVGYASGQANGSAANNTGVGSQSMYNTTTGGNNTSLGYNSMFANTTGTSNVSVGYQANFNNGSATSTTAIGFSAASGGASYSAQQLTAVGTESLASIITGASGNTALGYRSGFGLTSGANNILLGLQAGDNLTTGSNNIVLGYDIDAPTSTASNTLNIGNIIFGSGISGSGTTTSPGKIGIGTSTPQWTLQVASSTKAQLTLSDNSLTSNHWSFRNAGGNLYIATSSPSTFATSTYTSLTVDGSSGNIGIGTSTPKSRLSIATSTGFSTANPILSLGPNPLTSGNSAGTLIGSNLSDNGFSGDLFNFQTQGVNRFTVTAGSSGAATHLILTDRNNDKGFVIQNNGTFTYDRSVDLGSDNNNFNFTDVNGNWFTSGDYTNNYLSIAPAYAPTATAINTRAAVLRVEGSMSTGAGALTTWSSLSRLTALGISTTIGSGSNDLYTNSLYPITGLDVNPTINVNTFSRGYTALRVNPVQTSVSATSTNYIADFQISSSSKMVITSGGQVGIGTTTPKWSLQVASSTRAQLTLSDGIAADTHWSFRNAGGNLYIATSSASTYATSSASALTVDTNGSLGVGTTSPWKTFSVSGTASLKGLTATGASDVQLCLSTNNEVTTGATCGTSSLRFKHDINTLTANLDEVMKFRPVSFVYNGYTDEKTGFIAEEINQIDPRLVFYDEDGVTPRGVLYDNFAPILAGAIQELNNKIDTLTASTTEALANFSLVQGGLKIDSLSSPTDLLLLESDAEFVGRPYFNSDTGGLAVIETGSRKVDVTFDKPYVNAPVISATITLDASTTDTDRDAIITEANTYAVTNRNTNGFSIILNKPAEKQVTFSWIALAIKNMKTATSASTTQPILSTVTDLTSGGQVTITPPVDNSSTTPILDNSSQQITEEGSSTPIIDATASTTSTSTPLN